MMSRGGDAMSKLLLDEYPLLLLPSLAKAIGLYEAIIIQQLHYWMCNPKMGKFVDGVHWIKNSTEQWQQDNFPFMSLNTVRRTFAELRRRELILVRSDLNFTHTDRTLWYSVHYANLQNAFTLLGQMDLPYLGNSLSETTSETTPSNSYELEGKREQVAPSFSTNGKVPEAPTGYLWITSSISTEKLIHLSSTEKGKILCGASLKHRTTDYQHVAASTPCPECLKAAQKPKLEQPPKEVKDRFAQICFGQSSDLTPASWGLIVKAWNQMGKPDVAELKTLEDAWYKQDWRGKRGERPKPLQLAAERDSLKAKSVKREHYGVQLTAAQQEMYAKFPILEKFPASEWSWRVREQNFK